MQAPITYLEAFLHNLGVTTRVLARQMSTEQRLVKTIIHEMTKASFIFKTDETFPLKKWVSHIARLWFCCCGSKDDNWSLRVSPLAFLLGSFNEHFQLALGANGILPTQSKNDDDDGLQGVLKRVLENWNTEQIGNDRHTYAQRLCCISRILEN